MQRKRKALTITRRNNQSLETKLKETLILELVDNDINTYYNYIPHVQKVK